MKVFLWLGMRDFLQSFDAIQTAFYKRHWQCDTLTLLQKSPWTGTKERKATQCFIYKFAVAWVRRSHAIHFTYYFGPCYNHLG
jgi:hypothetical protein